MEQADVAKDHAERADKNAIVAQSAATAARSAEKKSMKLAIDKAESSAQNIAVSGTIELRNDHALRALPLFDSAGHSATDSRESLSAQISTTRANNPAAENDDDPSSWTALNARLQNSEWLSDGNWRQRKTNLLRQFPYTVWNRELGTVIQAAVLSPDKRLLALTLDKANLGHRIVVWDIAKNLPTEFFVDVDLAPIIPRLCWSPDSKSVFVFVNLLDATGAPSDRTSITRYSATTGVPIGAARSHTGLVHSAGCSPDGKRLYVANQFDGSQPELLRTMSKVGISTLYAADTNTDDGVLSVLGALPSSNKGASVYCLDTSDFAVIDSHCIDGPIVHSSIAAETVVVSYYERPDWNHRTFRTSSVPYFRISSGRAVTRGSRCWACRGA